MGRVLLAGLLAKVEQKGRVLLSLLAKMESHWHESIEQNSSDSYIVTLQLEQDTIS